MNPYLSLKSWETWVPWPGPGLSPHSFPSVFSWSPDHTAIYSTTKYWHLMWASQCAQFLCRVENMAARESENGGSRFYFAEPLCVSLSYLPLSSLICEIKGLLPWAPGSLLSQKGPWFSDDQSLEPVFHISKLKLKTKFFPPWHEAHGGLWITVLWFVTWLSQLWKMVTAAKPPCKYIIVLLCFGMWRTAPLHSSNN